MKKKGIDVKFVLVSRKYDKFSCEKASELLIGKKITNFSFGSSFVKVDLEDGLRLHLEADGIDWSVLGDSLLGESDV